MFLTKLKVFTLVTLLCCSGLSWATIKVVTVFDDFASITKSIGGDLVSVTSLVSGSKNMHYIKAKPSMVLKLRDADLLIRLGMDQDSWIDGVIHVSKNPKVFPNKIGYLDASKSIEKLEVPVENVSPAMGDTHIEGNPHYWLSPYNGIVIARSICDHLNLISPENKEIFEKNYERFSRDLEQNIRNWKLQLASLQAYEIITYHKVWSYFFDAFDLNGIGQLEPLPGIRPTTKHLHALEKKLKASDAKKIVLTATFYSDTIGRKFAKKIKAPFISASTNVGDDGILTYSDLFEHLVTQLKQ